MEQEEGKTEELIVRRSYAQVNGSLVHLVRYESCRNLHTAKRKKVLVFIPCNLGQVDLNHDFLVHLFRNLERSCEPDTMPLILAIGHNNFQFPANMQDIGGEKLIVIDDSNMRLVDQILAKDFENEPNHLELQVINKLVILRHLFGKDYDQCEFTFVGHSVGCYIILKLLQDRALSSAHCGSVLIHPALCDVDKTERGTYWVQFFRYKLHLLALFIMFILENFVPESIIMLLIRWTCKDEFVVGSSDVVIRSTVRMACYRTAQSTMEMAESALRVIKYTKSMAMIQPVVHKLKFIYALNDHWVDPCTVTSLRETYPNIYIEENPVQHAFMMSPKTVENYAFRVAKLIKNMIN